MTNVRTAKKAFERSFIHLLIQKLVCRIGILVQKIILSTMSAAVVLQLKLCNLLLNVARYPEWIAGAKK